jgi:hypothetical protein
LPIGKTVVDKYVAEAAHIKNAEEKISTIRS